MLQALEALSVVSSGCCRISVDGAPVLHIDMAGNTCTPWSVSGNRHGWCDKAILASLCWGQHLHITAPDIVLNECTPKWPASLFFGGFLPSSHSCTGLLISPVDLGLPCARPRLYTLACKDATVALKNDWRSLLVESCCRSVASTAAIYFVAPSAVQDDYVKELAGRRRIDLPTSGPGLQARDLLTPDARQRLRDYKAALAPKLTDEIEAAVVHISQNIWFGGSAKTVKEIMPTLKGLLESCCLCVPGV